MVTPCRYLTAGSGNVAPMRRSGFTLVELLVTIAVFVILVAIALPNFSELIRNQKARSAASDLYASLLFAHSEAIKRNSTVTVSRSGVTWDAGWTVASGTTVLKRQDPYTAITITPNGTVGSSFSFGSNGRPLAVSPVFLVYVTAHPETFAKCVSLSLSGMPSITDDPNTDRSGC